MSTTARRPAAQVADVAGVMTGLETMARQLREAPIGPSDEFRMALRRRLVAVASVSPAAAVAPARASAAASFRNRARASLAESLTDALADALTGLRIGRNRLHLAIGGASMAVVIGGVAAATSWALPGDLF